MSGGFADNRQIPHDGFQRLRVFVKLIVALATDITLRLCDSIQDCRIRIFQPWSLEGIDGFRNDAVLEFRQDGPLQNEIDPIHVKQLFEILLCPDNMKEAYRPVKLH